MGTDENAPAEHTEEASGRYHAVERTAPKFLAHRMFAQVVDMCGEADADLHMSKVIAELLALSPVAREHISDLVLVDLVEELHRHGEPGRDAARMVGVVQRDWMNGRG